jgi:hypothetical protein
MQGLVLGSLLAAALAAGGQAPPVRPDLAPRVAAFDARIEALQEKQRSMPPPRDLEEALQRRRALDQAIRNGAEMAGLPLADRIALQQAIDPSVRRIEAENAAFAKSVIPAEGWFRESVYGFPTAGHAWTLVMHSSDPELQKQVLAKLEPLLAQGEVTPMFYAHLYDRVQLAEKRKQRYGTHAACKDGRMAVEPMDEPEKVQERRDAIGFKLPPFTELAELFARTPC